VPLFPSINCAVMQPLPRTRTLPVIWCAALSPASPARMRRSSEAREMVHDLVAQARRSSQIWAALVANGTTTIVLRLASAAAPTAGRATASRAA
jgi:hypothetical protein